jgi:RNA polymerase sigma-70 factor (ECF subfamily)
VRIIDREDFIHSDSELLESIMNATSQAVSENAGFSLEESSAGPVFIPKTQENNVVNAALTNTETDYELVQMAARGNLAAFENIYQRYHRRAYSICLRMTQSTAEAEDLTQEVFIQLFRKMGSFRGESAFSTWLHRLTVNQVLMHFRRRGVQVEKTTDDGEVPEQTVPGTENFSRMPVLDRIALDNAIAQLPPGYRTVFVLHDVEGFEHEEIARMLGLSIGTSKSQLHKARLKLRGLILQQKQ